MALHHRLATPAAKQRYVRALFAAIADRYDLITVVLSYGQDRRWKQRLVGLAAARRGTRALDLATGTGDIAFELAAAGAQVVGLDVTHRMIQLARAKMPQRPAVEFIVGDMLALPFPGASFDVATVGYGLRNVPDLDKAIAELFRVVRSGGRVLSLDFNRPANRGVRLLYLAYLTLVGSVLGWLLHRDPDTYRYIPASLRSYPGGAGVAAMLKRHGFVRVFHHPVLGGLMSIHEAHKD
jgi:ubiquinone/menaquinone biosynthesis methyltransferase